MKKLLIILLAGIFIAGCNGNGEEENSNGEDNSNAQAEENNDEGNAEENGAEQQDIYQIGETAQTNSSSYGFPYEITVNDFEVTADEVDGYVIEDFTSDPAEERRFAVVNVTLKNTSDESFVPSERMSAQLLGELTYETDRDEFFEERKEELEPGEEITGNIVYLANTLFDDGVVYLTYEASSPSNEVRFELPVPEQ